MGRYAEENGGGHYEQAPIGNHIARCVRMVDLGTQTGEYEGKQTLRNQVLIMWELCHEMTQTDEGERPFLVSKFYTNSLNEKASLRKDLINWRGRDFTPDELRRFDLQTILGAACLVNVVHNDKGRAKVTGVAKLPKGQSAPEPHNELVAFWLDEFDADVFDGLSDGIKKIIQASPEYQNLGKPRSQPPSGSSMADMDDDIPF